jgi:hypothetical protein
VDEGLPLDDPGWRSAVDLAAKGLVVPWVGLSGRRPSGGVDGLVALRSLVLTFVLAVSMIGVVVAVLDRYGRLPAQLEAIPVAGAVVACGVLAQLAGAFVERPLDGSTAAALAAAYRTRFFVRVGLAESAALLGFVGFILTGAPAVYLAGSVMTLVGFTRLAPTRARLAADQQRLSSTGSAIRLVAALRGSIGPSSASSAEPP